MVQDNRKRALAEVVSLDAWHRGFTSSRKAVNLHVDVAFATGRIGGDGESNVRFRLRLKRAEVVVIVPSTEPAKIDKASVSRDAPGSTVENTETRRTESQARTKLKLGGTVKATAISAAGGAELGAATSRARDQVLRITREVTAMSLKQVTTADGDYAWLIEPTVEEALDGRPWDAKKKPRLTIVDTRADREHGIEPMVRVEVRCRREDLDIRDIELKEKSWADRAKDPLGRNRTLAAEAVIRTRLFEAGFLTGDMSDPFAQLTISATIAASH